MTFDMSQFLDTFYEESFEGLQIMEEELLNLDVGTADSEIINTIFRAAHSIKGGSGTFGLSSVADFTHIMETLLDEMRDGRRKVTQETVDLLLVSVDVLRDMLLALKNNDDLNYDKISMIHSKLENLLNNAKSENVSTNETNEPQVTRINSVEKYQIIFKPGINMLKTGNDPVRIIRELGALGEINTIVDVDSIPHFNDLDPEEIYLSWIMDLSGKITQINIKEIFEWVDGDCELTINDLAGTISQGDELDEEEKYPAEERRSSDRRVTNDDRRVGDRRKSQSTTSSIRVNIDKVDDLINMVGELVITQSMLNQMGETDSFDAAHIDKLRDGLTQLEQHTRELQESVMRIRMMPISFAFQRFPRLVHDLSTQFSKKIELKLSGEQTELDKTVMEKIADPLVHLVRNSLDHGIESPEQRLAVNKPEKGTIELNAYHQGGNIVIEIVDDGAGLDRDKILEKAQSKGLIKTTDTLTDDLVKDLIFKAGFSTADVVSDVSGRGVGMDVVRRNIRSLGGTIDVDSKRGEGSKFTIRLPLTLAILDGQLVKVGNETYIVPLISIIESLQIKSDLINAVTGRAEVYKLREEYIPIVRLYQIFNIEPVNKVLDNGLLVVVEAENKKIALLVDDLLGQQQVVIKSLETNFKKIEGLSGATILGDGTVALILDITGLMELYQTNLDRPELKLIQGGEAAA